MTWKETEPAPRCHHLWFRIKREENRKNNLVRLTHRCPKCHRTKVTVRLLDSSVKRWRGRKAGVAFMVAVIALCLVGCADFTSELACGNGDVVWVYKTADSTWSSPMLDEAGRSKPCGCMDTRTSQFDITPYLMLSW